MAKTVNTMANDGGGTGFYRGAIATPSTFPYTTAADTAAAALPATTIGTVNRAPGLSMVDNVTGNSNGTVYDQIANGKTGYEAVAAQPEAAATGVQTTPTAGAVTGSGTGAVTGGANTNTGEASDTATDAGTPANGYVGTVLPGVTDLTAYQEELYAKQQEAKLAALERTYMAQLAELDKQAATVPQYYYEAGRQVTGQNAREQQAMNEQFAAMGLNTGAAGQAALAQNAVYQGNIAGIKQAEANALAEIEADRTALAMDYQAQIREAILNNESEKAAALYEEMLRQDEYMVSNAIAQAQLDMQTYQIQTEAADKELAQLEERAATMAALGDYSLYKYLGYTDEQIAALSAAYNAKNYSYGGSEALTAPQLGTEATNVYNAITRGDDSVTASLLEYYLKSNRISADEAEYLFALTGV